MKDFESGDDDPLRDKLTDTAVLQGVLIFMIVAIYLFIFLKTLFDI